jgi:hypothetical protein
MKDSLPPGARRGETETVKIPAEVTGLNAACYLHAARALAARLTALQLRRAAHTQAARSEATGKEQEAHTEAAE